MNVGEIEELRRVTKDGTPWYVFAVHAFEPTRRLLDERQTLIDTINMLLEREPAKADHYGCDRLGAECVWCYARGVLTKANPKIGFFFLGEKP